MLKKTQVLTYLLLMVGSFAAMAASLPLSWNESLHRYEGHVDRIDVSQNKIIIGDVPFRIEADVSVVTSQGYKRSLSRITQGARIQFLTTEAEGQSPMIYSGNSEIGQIWIIQ